MKPIFATLLELAGALTIGYGLWSVFPPVACLWGGACLMWVGYTIETFEPATQGGD